MAVRVITAVWLAGLIGRGALAEPVNDDFASASVFNPASNSVTGTIAGATREPGEDARFGYSVWWRWTAPTNGAFTFVVESGQFRPFLLVAPSGTNLLIGLSNPIFIGIIAPFRFATEFPISANGGTEYTVALFTYSNSPAVGDYTLRVIASAPPSATFVQPAAPRTRHVVGEPLDLEVEAHDGDGRVVRVDFYIITPGAGSVPGSSPLAGSTSSPPYRISAATTGAIANRDSGLLAEATDDAGLFGVAGYVVGNQVDQIRYIAFRQPAPPNDNFAARVPLSADFRQLEADNGGAGREAGEPVTSGEQTLWWSWTASASRDYYILARGLLSFPRITVFTGDALAALNSVSNDDNSGCGNLAWGFLAAQAGQTYQISVGDSCESFGGPFTLHVLPTDAAPQIVDARIRRAREVANVPVFELLAVGLQQTGWTVESSGDLQQWEPCDTEWPYGWVDDMLNWADTFRARVDLSLSRFYRLRRTP